MIYSGLKARIRALVDDDEGTFTDDAYLEPRVGQAYDDLFNSLRTSGFEFDEQVVHIENVAAGTSDLSAFAGPGKPLELLIAPNPFGLEAKQTGLPEISYYPVQLTDRIRDSIANQTVDLWEWRGQTIYITPSTLATDFRVRGDFVPATLVNNGDVIGFQKNVGSCLAYKVAVIIGKSRGNPNWVKDYGADAALTLNDIHAEMVKADQSKVRRVGRVSRQPRQKPFSNFR